jgi:hypothetical protein
MTDEPGYPPGRVIRPVRRPLLAAGIAGLAGATMLASLWATEPLPARTRTAFAGLIVIGLSWAVLAVWALVRRPLFAEDRVIAAGLAVVFTTATTVVTAVVAGPLAAGPGLLTAAVAIVLLVRARAHRSWLLSQVAALERQRRES